MEGGVAVQLIDPSTMTQKPDGVESIQVGDARGVQVDANSFPILSPSHAVHWELAKQGLGACVMIEEVGDREPAVCRVLDDLPALPIPFWLTSHRGLRTTRRLRVVFDLLADALSEPAGPGR